MANSAINVILVIIGILIAIFVHEAGHFIVAKIANVRVFEFSVGLGPKIFKKRKNNTLYAFRLLPLGGYVLVASKLVVRELQKTKEKQYMNVKENEFLESKKPWVRIVFYLGGVTMNFIFSLFLALFIDYLVYGRFVFDLLLLNSFKTIEVLFEEIFTGAIFFPETSQVTGIVGSTVAAAQSTAQINWYFFYYLGLSLIAFNLLPIPPLDGFKIVETLFTSYVLKRDFKQKPKIVINSIGAGLIALLFLFLIIGDIIKIS